MSDDARTGTEVITRPAAVPLPPMDDAEMASMYRTAKALAESRLFKDAMQAGQAFAKILAGRDLGLTPFEAMSGLHVIEGKVEAGADLHATRVRSHDGYDFRVAWLKVEPRIDLGDTSPPTITAVWADEEDIADLREVYGCAIEFTVGGKRRGVSRWTAQDSATAGLIREKGNHQKFPRNMYFARAMTNGVAWFVPEVMGGMRVYGHGEIQERGGDLSAGEGSGEPAGLDLPTEVEAIIARAVTLGHAGLADRATVEMAVADQPAEYIRHWVREATRELNAMAAGHEPQPSMSDLFVAGLPEEVQSSPHLSDALRAIDGRTIDDVGRLRAEVVALVNQRAAEQAAETPPEPETAPEAESPADATDAPQAPESADEATPSEGVERMRAEARRLWAMADSADAAGETERAEAIRDEAFSIQAEVEAATAQGTFDVEA